MFGYTDGLLGTPDSIGNYNATLNAYRYFCDDLTSPDSQLPEVTQEKRGIFSAGQKNIRHYSIELGDDGLVFNYAVDANWVFPEGDYPWEAPADFPPEANRAEAWRISIAETENTLWNDGESSGGDLRLSIDVYDWFDADANAVTVESPGNFSAATSSATVGGGEGYSTYEIEIIGATPTIGAIDLLVSVDTGIADYQDFVPGASITSYFTHTVSVSGETPAAFHWEFDTGGLLADYTGYDDISPALAWETDDQLRCIWVSDDLYETHPYSIPRGRRSDDGGQTWIDSQTYGSHGNSRLRDHTKLMPADNGNSFLMYSLSYKTGDDPHYEAGRSGDKAISWNYANMFVRHDDCGEVFCASDGYVHAFGDDLTGNPGIHQKKGNQQWTWFYDWSGHPDPPPNWWWPEVTVHEVAPGPAHISDTRSITDNSGGTIYLAYWGGVGSEFIKIAKSTDGPTGLTWEQITVFEETGYSDVRNPGIFIDDNDVVYVSFIRHHIDTAMDQICYTCSDDSGANWSDIDVVYSTAIKLTDTPIEVFEFSSQKIIAISFEEDDAVWMVSSFNGGSNWEEPELVSDEGVSVDQMPDMVVGTDDKLHFAWAHEGTTDWEIYFRNAELVED
jgi:hypothetical protein